MRHQLALDLHTQMTINQDIILLVGDLGFKMFDQIRKDYPKRFVNCGASEQAMMDMAVGLAYDGKIPVVYSITPFILYRAFETIRTYINHEYLHIILVGSGRDDNYKHDGYSHDASDVKYLFNGLETAGSKDDKKVIQTKGMFGNIKAYWPASKEEIPELLNKVVDNKLPTFISLKR